MLGKFIRRFLPGGGTTLRLSPGSPVPAFECLDHRGASVSSSDLSGKRYVLWFFPKASTGG